MSFESLSLHPTLVKATAALGYAEPTPIQAKAIPLALSGRDVLGAAQTGGGKTAAFVLPILHGLLTKPGPGPRVLILVPTRELAVQVDRVIKECSRFSPVKTAVIIGGVGHSGQTHAVRQGAQILVATPGRLMDHLEQKNFQLHRIDQLVLDEADRMLDMGFLPDIKDILKHVPPERQTQLYSATLHKDVERIASFALRDPARVEVEKPATVAEGISQIAYPVIQSQKIPLLLTLLNSTEMRSVLVFTRTKHGADKVSSGSPNAATARASFTPTGPRISGRPPWTISATPARGFWWPPTSPPGESTSKASATWSISTCRGTRRTTSTAWAAPPGPTACRRRHFARGPVGRILRPGH